MEVKGCRDDDLVGIEVGAGDNASSDRRLMGLRMPSVNVSIHAVRILIHRPRDPSSTFQEGHVLTGIGVDDSPGPMSPDVVLLTGHSTDGVPAGCIIGDAALQSSAPVTCLSSSGMTSDAPWGSTPSHGSLWYKYGSS
jgi:hypothetical protein